MKTAYKNLLKFGLIFLIFLLLLTPLCRQKSVCAETPPKTSEEQSIEDSYLSQLDKLQLADLEAYFQSLFNSNEPLKSRLIAFIKGGDFDYASFGNKLLETLLKKLTDLFPSFACIVAISLTTGIIASIKSEANGKTATNMIFLIAYAASLVPLIGVLSTCFQATIYCIQEMKTQMDLIFPIMLTLTSASGASLTASLCQPAVGFFSTTIVSIIRSIVLPLTVAVIVFSMAGHISKDLKINKFTAFFTSLNKWIIGICVSVFGLFLTLQGITTSAYDGVVRRAAKYALGAGIPIVGGFLSGGFDLTIAGSILIKNSLGNMGIFLMGSVLFEPFVLLIGVTLLLRLSAAITQPFGDTRISDFLGETANYLQYCTASLLLTAFLYFLTVMVMIFASEALF